MYITIIYKKNYSIGYFVAVKLHNKNIVIIKKRSFALFSEHIFYSEVIPPAPRSLIMCVVTI